MKQNRLYDEFADWWTLVSPPEGYVQEASYWKDALRAKLGPGRHEILELGVGGGNNLSHLTGEFQATAVDISERMLANSVMLNPGVEHHVGDMRTIRLSRTFLMRTTCGPPLKQPGLTWNPGESSSPLLTTFVRPSKGPRFTTAPASGMAWSSLTSNTRPIVIPVTP